MTATTTPQQTTGIGQSWVPGSCSEPSSSSLTCQHVLSPPVQTLGEQGDEKALCYTNNSSPAWHCAFSPDGLYLAACFGAPDPCIRIWNKRMIVSAPVHPPTSIVVSPTNVFPVLISTTEKHRLFEPTTLFFPTKLVNISWWVGGWVKFRDECLGR